MLRTLTTVVFIGGVAAGAAYFAQRSTTIKGSVMAADLLEQLGDRGITEIRCADAEVKNHGATFRCHVAAQDGSRAEIEYVMDRAGAIKGTQIGATTMDRPTPRPPRDPGADPWGP